MEAKYFIDGLILIALSFLVIKFPILIAGYNILPKKHKKKVDIYSLSQMIKNHFLIMGVLSIITSFLFQLLNMENWLSISTLLIILPGIISVLLHSIKYAKNLAIYTVYKYICILVCVYVLVNLIITLYIKIL